MVLFISYINKILFSIFYSFLVQGNFLLKIDLSKENTYNLNSGMNRENFEERKTSSLFPTDTLLQSCENLLNQHLNLKL